MMVNHSLPDALDQPDVVNHLSSQTHSQPISSDNPIADVNTTGVSTHKGQQSINKWLVHRLSSQRSNEICQIQCLAILAHHLKFF
jgi:hypothetical protein